MHINLFAALAITPCLLAPHNGWTQDAPKPGQILTPEEAKKKGLKVRPLGRKLPFEALPPPDRADGLKERLAGKDSAIWIDGDVLNVLHRSGAPGVQLTGGLQMPMKKVADTDLWIVRLKMEGWDKAFFSYAFIPSDKPPVGIKLEPWYGPNSPKKTETVKDLKGGIVDRTLNSKSLGEERKITVYLPPNAPKSGLPAFFMADGQGCKSFAGVLEPLILAGKVKPVAIIGIHSGHYKGDRTEPYDPKKDMRATEYVPGENPDRFDKHMEFFTREVADYVQKEFGISARREDRAVVGFSNGGAFAAAVAVRMPGFFAHSVPLSAGIPPTDPKPERAMPVFHFAAGKLETFSFSTTEIHNQVKGWGANATLELYVAGHDPLLWEMAFARYAQVIFPAS
jgi:enterochelin esterase-like enzyme